MNFKLKKENCKGSNFLTFKINDKGKEIVLDKIADAGEGFEEFVEQLPEDDGLYGVIDVKYETSDNRSTSKMIFVSWVPDTMRIKKKMLYAGSKEALKSTLDGVGISINCTDLSEIDYESVLQRLKKY